MKGIPQLVEKYNSKIANNDKVEFIHVSLEDDKETLAWARKAKMPWPILPQNKMKSAKVKDLGVQTYIMYDANGKKIAEGSTEVFNKAASLK